MTASSAPNRADVMDILKDDKSVTYGVDEASRHLTFVLSARQTNCVNGLGGNHHGSTPRLFHAFVRFRPLMQPRHYLSDAAGVVAPDQADLGGALAEGLEAHQVVGVDHPAGELSGLQTVVSHSARRAARKTADDSHTPSLTPPSSSPPSSSRTPFVVGWWLRCTCVCAAGRSTGAGRDR